MLSSSGVLSTLHRTPAFSTSYCFCWPTVHIATVLSPATQDCASSDYSASEAELSPPLQGLSQSCPPGIAVRPPAFSRTASDSVVALHMAQASINNGPAYPTRHILRPSCSPLATVQYMSPPSGPAPPVDSVSPPVWQRTGSVPLHSCLYGQ